MLNRLCPAAAATAEAFKGDLMNPTYYPTKADTAAVNKRCVSAPKQLVCLFGSLPAAWVQADAWSCTGACMLTVLLLRRWYVIDAEGQTLGRLATLAAMYIRCAPIDKQ